MGAPGNAFICARGHLYHWIDDDLFWDDSLFREEREVIERGCPCGTICFAKIPHYGDLNDCICLKEEIPERGIMQIGEEILRVPIPGAVDAAGNPIEAYVERVFPVYNLGRIPFRCVAFR